MTERPTILYLVHRVPYPPDKGDRIRNYHVLRYLAGWARVYLACLADEDVPQHSRAVLEPLCEKVAIARLGKWSRWLHAARSLARGATVTEGAFWSPMLADVIAAWAAVARFDAVLASASSMVPYLSLPALRSTPAVVDLVDVDSQKWLEYAGSALGPKAWLYRTEGRRLRRLEQSLPARCRAITLVSAAEAALFRQFCSAGSVLAVSNGVDLDYFRPGLVRGTEPVNRPAASDANSCVFVGALDYRPNVDAVLWFAAEVWPRLSALSPGARFYVVGRRPARALRRLAGQPGLELVGQVPDVRPFLERADVVVAPLRIARGLQNKVLEAVAMGKAVVASRPALAGIGARPGLHLLAATAPQEWIDTIWWLWNDLSLRSEIAAAGRRYVLEHHSWDRCLEPFRELLDKQPAQPSECHPVPARVCPEMINA